jgi:putative Mg2+ transporter-C (MgtC) family protein
MQQLSLVEQWQELESVLIPFLMRCGVAALCGAMIGLERELKQKPAGFRTNILICVGAAMYMAVGLLLMPADRSGIDPTRIAAQVVTGIGFLGAGCIMQQGAHVTGLTTAATIWVVAGIGLVSGAGYPLLAIASAGAVLATLAILGPIEDRLFRSRQADDPRNAKALRE